MLHLTQAVVVEGRYDKNALSQLIDAPIFQTDGFGIMKNPALLSLLERAARTRGLIIFTDSDGAGFVIRNYLKGRLPKQGVFHAYIPDIYGKEKRKPRAGKEGKLGVEGMPPEILLQALQSAGVTAQENARPDPITNQDLYTLGLSGTANSAEARKRLKARLQLPEHLGTHALLDALNLFYTKEAFYKLIQEGTL